MRRLLGHWINKTASSLLPRSFTVTSCSTVRKLDHRLEARTKLNLTGYMSLSTGLSLKMWQRRTDDIPSSELSLACFRNHHWPEVFGTQHGSLKTAFTGLSGVSSDSQTRYRLVWPLITFATGTPLFASLGRKVVSRQPYVVSPRSG